MTACGTFARAAHDTPNLFAHTKFYASGADDEPDGIAPGLCRTCIGVLDIPVEPITHILDRLGVPTERQAA